MIKVKVNLLTKESFTVYGDYITYEKNNPTLEEKIFNFWNEVGQIHMGGKADISILEVFEQEKVYKILERHFDIEEVFFALDSDFIISVTEPNLKQDIPDFKILNAFKLEEGKGVILKKGTWHWVPFPESGEGKMHAGY